MDWIKKNYEQALLLAISTALLVSAGLLVLRATSFKESFSGLSAEVTKSKDIKPLDVARMDNAQQAVATPPTWSTKHLGSLFVSRRYIVLDGSLVNPLKGGAVINPPVPNPWFEQNKLDILSPGILDEDPDKDGFSNLDEWTGLDAKAPGTASTDPNDPKSHPAYLTKLRLKQAINEPFRLVVQTYDGDPAKPESLTVQINTLDVRQPSQFLKIGDLIAGTKFKITGFEQKMNVSPESGFEKDVSELTVENTETSQKVVLVLEQITNSPDSFALFTYLWDNSELRVKKDATFTLKPESDVQYKLIDIKTDAALIQNLKTQETHSVPMQQAGS